jgi:hypothetical protein
MSVRGRGIFPYCQTSYWIWILPPARHITSKSGSIRLLFFAPMSLFLTWLWNHLARKNSIKHHLQPQEAEGECTICDGYRAASLLGGKGPVCSVGRKGTQAPCTSSCHRQSPGLWLSSSAPLWALQDTVFVPHNWALNEILFQTVFNVHGYRLIQDVTGPALRESQCPEGVRTSYSSHAITGSLKDPTWSGGLRSSTEPERWR